MFCFAMAPTKPANLAPLEAPDKFSFANPEQWPRWLQRFNRYRVASNLKQQSEERQINTLIYTMGEEADDILLSFDAEITHNYDAVTAAFTKYFKPRRNIIYERANFNSRLQNDGEPVEEFITELYRLAELCDFRDKAMKEEMIRDRLVVGIRNQRLKERLQLEDDLDLKKAMTMIRNAEQVKKQQQSQVQCVGAVKSPQQQQQPLQGSQQSQRPQSSKWGQPSQQKHSSTGGQPDQHQPASLSQQPQGCGFCGGSQRHSKMRCPAGSAKCHKCFEVGHFARQCRHKSGVRQVEDNVEVQSNASDEEMFMMKVDTPGRGPMPDAVDRYRTIYIRQFGTSRKFLLDTGADRVSLPYRTIPEYCRSKIRPTKTKFHGADGQALNVVGSLAVTLCFEGMSYECDAIVMTGLTVPLLSYQAVRFFKMFTVRQVHLSGTPLSGMSTQSKSSVNVANEFPRLFQKTIGQFKDEISLVVNPSIKPHAQAVPRPVPIPILAKLETEISRLLGEGIIEKVEHVTPWVSPIVCVKKGDQVRLCGDYTRLNAAVQRPYHPLPKVEYTLAKISGAKIFSKIDATKSFYQVKLNESSKDLTTFICPLGRFRFTRLPFGINASTELFVSKFSKILDGIEGVIYHVDDVLIHAQTQNEHDRILRLVLSRMQEEGITINKEKSVFGVGEVTYLGHVLSDKGIRVDPERVQAIRDFPIPTSKEEIQSFVGVVQFASRFIPNKSEVLAPLNYILKKDVEFTWGPEQQKAFTHIQNLLTQSPTLAFFDPNQQITLSADASSYGIGACLYQTNHVSDRRIIAYASRAMTATECRYAQIEREALALTWAATKFSQYIEGLEIELETDHKALLQILQTKFLDELSPRLARFRMRLMRFTYKVRFVPGRELVLPDYLSRHVGKSNQEKEELQDVTEAYVSLVVSQGNIKPQFLEKIRQAQNDDSVCTLLKVYMHQGWPVSIPCEAKPYHQHRHDLTLAEGLILKGKRILIPSSLRKQVLSSIHEGHLGITKCRNRAQQSVWWLGCARDITEMVEKCAKCIEHRTNIKEPFCNDTLPSRPWEVIGMDLFQLGNKKYLVVVDYFSRFFELFQLHSTTEDQIIARLKELFGRYGVCSKVRTDNGPQFQRKFTSFLSDLNVSHVTSSPYYSQSNGEAESFVKICKNLLKKNDDIHAALLAYRSTPLAHGYSPAELFFGRKLRTSLPMLESQLIPCTPDRQAVSQAHEQMKASQIQNYNRRHKVTNLNPFKAGDRVWVTDIKKYATVQDVLPFRSYNVVTDSGSVYRRNRWHLI